MNKEKLYNLVKEDLIIRHGDYDVLGEPDEIIDFMDIAMNRVDHQTRFRSFTEYLMYLGLSDEDIMWVYTEIKLYRR